VDAEYGQTSDTCFDSVIQVDDPALVSTTERLISVWDAGGVIKGKVRGAFTGAHPSMRFTGEGTGSSGWYGTVTRHDEFTIVNNGDGTFSFGGAPLGEIILGSCLVFGDGGDVVVDPTCVDFCVGGDVDLTASTTCGQTAASTVNVPTPSPITVIYDPVDISIGDFPSSTTGGVAPYSYSFDGGTVDSDTGEILSVTACGASGSARWATVTATDTCSEDGTTEVRLSGGEWGPNLSTQCTGGDNINNFCGFANCDTFSSTITVRVEGVLSTPNDGFLAGNQTTQTRVIAIGGKRSTETSLLNYNIGTGGVTPVATPPSEWPASKTIGPCGVGPGGPTCTGKSATAGTTFVRTGFVNYWVCP
jgi:hypothetical protein